MMMIMMMIIIIIIIIIITVRDRNIRQGRARPAVRNGSRDVIDYVTIRFDSPYAISYSCSTGTESLSPAVFEIFDSTTR